MEFDELLERVQLGKRDIVVNLHIDEPQDMSEELLGIVLAPVNDRVSTLGMAIRDERFRGTALVDGLVPWAHCSFPLMGVAFVLIDCFHQLFTYPNIPLIQTNL